jgi:hypothetical protein
MDERIADFLDACIERWRAAMDLMREMMSTWPDCV